MTDGFGTAWDTLTGRLGEKWRRFIDGLPIPGAVKRWLGMGDAGPGQTGATGTIPPAGSAPAPAPLVVPPPGSTTTPPGPRQGPPTGATGSFGPMKPASSRNRPPIGRTTAGGRATPAAAPAVPSARPAPERHASLDIGGGVDINVRGPAEVRRVRSRDSRVPVNVNQGWSMVG